MQFKLNKMQNRTSTQSILGILFTGEIPGTYAFIGGLIVLTAISLRELCIKK